MPYASPHHVSDPRDCYFYHTMELPGHGLVKGEWDLRDGVAEYLGSVDLAGKRVLEIGTASGFLCFAMEKRGAEVVAHDLSPEQSADIVPFARADVARAVRDHCEHVRRINNAFWLAHRVLGSQAKVIYSTAYELPAEIGRVDISTFGCVLLHLRDPIQALTRAASLTNQMLIVTEPVVVHNRLKRWLLSLAGPAALFFPHFPTATPLTTWWVLTPEIIQSWLGILGFEDTRVTYHQQLFHRKRVPLFTVVGRRT
jgi:hypothetical protein